VDECKPLPERRIRHHQIFLSLELKLTSVVEHDPLAAAAHGVLAAQDALIGLVLAAQLEFESKI
jgi:hypothetical protein